jgi:hypothetical protein
MARCLIRQIKERDRVGRGQIDRADADGCKGRRQLAYRVDHTRALYGRFKSPKFAVLVAAAVPLLGFSAAQADDSISVTVELNKLETQDKGCRVYTVVDNAGATTFDVMKLDLVLFQPDGVIGRRIAVDLAPLKPSKKTVKLFDLDGTACDTIGSFLINDVVECKSDKGPVEQCLAGITVKSLTKVQLSK